MDPSVMIPIGAFGTPVLLAYFYLRYRSKKLEILEKLIDGSNEITPEVLAVIHSSAANKPGDDIRMAIFYIAIGVALLLMLSLQVFNNPPRLSLVSLLPLCIGVSYLLASRIDNSQEKNI